MLNQQNSPAPASADRLQLVLELGQRVTSILDLDTLLPEACRLIADTFHYDLVGISLLDPLDATRLYQAAAFPKERSLPRTFRVPLDRGLTGWVARNGRSRLANDVTRDPFYIPGPGRTTKSELDVPLRVASGTIGVLNVESEKPDRFAAEDVPYLEGIGVLLAQAIENASLARRGRHLAASEERARIARDLHDETIQALVAMARQLDLLELDLSERARAQERLDTLRDLVDRAREGLIRLSRNLRPMVLEDLGLVAALEEAAEGVKALGLSVEVEVLGEPVRLSPSIEYAVYRVALEALTNAARHSGANRAFLRLVCSDDAVELTVRDQGVGFIAEETGLPPATTGRTSMRDRASEIGAELRIDSRPGQGTTIRLIVPVRPTMVDHA